MKVACVQQKAQGIEEYNDVIENVRSLVEEAAENGAELIILPESAYPAYFLGINPKANEKALEETPRYLQMIADLAKRLRVDIATGVALRDKGKLYNAAVYFDEEGKIINRAYKSNMWHFDSRWYTPGEEFKAFDTRFGRMGMLVCADGRVPEIARILALDGAEVIIDPVNLAAAAADPKQLMNQQFAFILPVRAMENNVWFLVADKAGLEENTVSYLGRSMIIDPNGNIVVDASTDRQEIIYWDINMSGRRYVTDNRRPELYSELVKDNEELDVYADLTSKLDDISQAEVFISAAQFNAKDSDEYCIKATHYCMAGELMGTKLMCLPKLKTNDDISAIAVKLQKEIKSGIIVVTAGRLNGLDGALVFDNTEIYDKFYRTHGEGTLSDKPFSIVKTPYGKIGVIFDNEAYVQEVARSYMLLGCEILLWMDDAPRPMNKKVMQTRAAENKLFVVRTNPVVTGDTANIVNPDGAEMTSTFIGTEQAASAMAFIPLAKAKSVVPGTNVVLGRIGKAYGRLI